ncbi:MAG: glycosyltransferase family 39 protein, partial [Acidobacteriota bacterium]
AKVPAISLDVRRHAIVLSVVILAAVLRVYAISLYPLAGDEYGSLAEAKQVGLNWNSIIYSGLMHFWIRLGNSELWLRLPSAIFGTATVAILFKLGEKLGGWRTGIVAALLAATSPFSIYHSQELRFYSFFILTAAAFMLATINYVEHPRTPRNRAAVWLTGAALVLSHFLGVLALYAQLAATAFAAKSRWSRRTLSLVLFGLPLLVCGLLLVPGFRHGLWSLYRIYGNAPSSVEPVMTPISIVNLVKAVFAGFVFVFGYHVYPLRFLLVAVGLGLSGILLLAGAKKLWKETRWGVLPVAYLLALLSVYFVLDVVGGRVAAGVSPRHVAFVWPVFLLLTAIGINSFRRPVLYILVAAALTVNAASIWSGWQKSWTYGVTPDYRGAGETAQRWIEKDTVLLHDGRSQDPVRFYFPPGIRLISAWPYQEKPESIKQLNNQRLIFVTDDWEPDRRRGFDQLMGRLNEGYSVIDGRVDYPLFEYAMARKSSSGPPAYALRAGTNQVLQPPSFYGIEFQDLRLPVSASVKGVSLSVIGSYGLPDSAGRRELSLPLSAATMTRRVILLSDVVGAGELQTDQAIAEVFLEMSNGKNMTIPLRLGKETTSWDRQCEPSAPCQTVFQWRKRLAVAGQNRYEGALRDFSAGLHGVGLDLPEPQEVVRLTIRYTAGSGRLYVWGLALPQN